MSESRGEEGEVNSPDALLISLIWKRILGSEAFLPAKALPRINPSGPPCPPQHTHAHMCIHAHTHTRSQQGREFAPLATEPLPAGTFSEPVRVLRSADKRWMALSQP